jgi:hypothetical protein
MAFKKGHKFAKGGKRLNAGRKPDEFKALMAQIASSKEAIELVTGAIEGKEVDEFLVLQTGVQVPVKPDAATRLKFLQYATDHGYGKANQPIEHSGDVGSRLIFVHPEESK